MRLVSPVFINIFSRIITIIVVILLVPEVLDFPISRTLPFSALPHQQQIKKGIKNILLTILSSQNEVANLFAIS